MSKFSKWIGDRWGDGPSVKGAKSALKGTSKLVNKFAPAATLIPGVGPLAAAAIAGASKLGAGGNLRDALVSGVTGYVGAKGIDKLTGGVDGIKGITGMVRGAGADGAGSMGRVGDFAGALTKGSLTDRAKQLASGVLAKATGGGGAGGGDGMGLVDKLLLGGSVAAGAEQQMRQRGFEDKAAGYATGAYDARAPLRERGMAMALDQSKVTVPQFSAPGNAYTDARLGRPQLGTAIPASTINL